MFGWMWIIEVSVTALNYFSAGQPEKLNFHQSFLKNPLRACAECGPP